MKGDRADCGVLFGEMAGSSPRFSSPAQSQYPTPSTPFSSYSISSTTWSPRPTLHLCNLIFRSLAFLFSSVSVISLAATSPHKKKGEAMFGFSHYPELRYCFGVTILASVYPFFQLFKGLFDIVHKGLLISDLVSDYLSFVLDHLLCYLLISSYLVSVPTIHRIESASPIGRQLLCRLLKVERIELGHVTCLLSIKPPVLNYYGSLHGGVAIPNVNLMW
ncbi:hypothetical protein NE237_012743 [Protea cynaroides]|uniref:CASP-like protein n=1 Tax=Protea cynaroides TaxID=273540 RepID=A0A9Q0H0P8_9MAGN|nr:hypothetical protein NE237_012743 [Protea cynaroides]